MSLDKFKNRKILFAGGGTGGHIFPGLAVIEKLRNEGSDIKFMWIGTSERLEAEIVPNANVSFKPIKIDYFKRSMKPASFLHNLGVTANLISFKSINQSKRIIRDFDPDIIVGLGSFVAGPVIVAAALSRKPSVLLELNAKPGRSTKWAAPYATLICLADPLAKIELKRFSKKLRITGCPIRENIIKIDRDSGIKKMGLNPDLKTILVLGGSQGAQTINKTFLAAWDLNFKRDHKKIDNVQVIHHWGKSSFPKIKEKVSKKPYSNNYHLFSFIINMSETLAASDIVISRAGANTIAEITARGIPAILIPYPHSAEQHQFHNAQALKINGAAELIEEKYLSIDYLLRLIHDILNDTKKYSAMKESSISLSKPNAVNDFINAIAEAANFD